MKLNFIETFEDKINKSGIDHFFCGSKSKELIAKAEKSLDVQFPKEYTDFLEKYGAGGVFGLEIYGIPTENLEAEGVPNAIWLTQQYRKKYNLSKDLIVIAESGIGDFYVIDCGKDYQGKILIWNPFNNKIIKEEREYNNFGEFIIQQLNQAIENWLEE